MYGLLADIGTICVIELVLENWFNGGCDGD